MKPFKPPAGAVITEPTNEYDHLALVPGVPDALASPEVRNSLLLRDWEGEAPSALPTPHGSVYVSKRTADSPIGLAFLAALARAVTREHLGQENQQ